MNNKFKVSVLTLLLTLFLVGCSTNKSSQHSDSKQQTTQVKKHKTAHKSKKSPAKKKSDDSKKTPAQLPDHQNSNTQQSVESQNPQQYSQTQGDINRDRGYDPNGNPIMPGQDHAAGTNPDGTPDAWVQGQTEWEKENGYLNPDGTPTQKGQQAIDEVNADASYDPNQ